MFTVEGVRLRVRGKIIKKFAKKRKLKLVNKNFTIISNNCWAGTIYESYDLPKMSPTIGMFFMAKDYICFLKYLRLFLDTQIEFIDPWDTKWNNCEVTEDSRFGTYPVGRLTIVDDKKEVHSIEIFFLHYKSEEEVISKWKRRIDRINWDKIIVKFNDQNECEWQDVVNFNKLDFKNKLFFTVRNFDNFGYTIKIDAPKKHEFIRASYEPFGKSKYINLTDYINSI